MTILEFFSVDGGITWFGYNTLELLSSITSTAVFSAVHGLPANGSAHQVLAKETDEDFDVGWVDIGSLISAGDGIRYNLFPQIGDWLYVETTSDDGPAGAGIAFKAAKPADASVGQFNILDDIDRPIFSLFSDGLANFSTQGASFNVDTGNPDIPSPYFAGDLTLFGGYMLLNALNNDMDIQTVSYDGNTYGIALIATDGTINISALEGAGGGPGRVSIGADEDIFALAERSVEVQGQEGVRLYAWGDDLLLHSDQDVKVEIGGGKSFVIVDLTDTPIFQVDEDGTITPTPSGGSVATDVIWDAIGDIVVGSGANTADNLTVGSDGQSLLADSGETLGVRWGWVTSSTLNVGGTYTWYDSDDNPILQLDEDGTLHMLSGAAIVDDL